MQIFGNDSTSYKKMEVGMGSKILKNANGQAFLEVIAWLFFLSLSIPLAAYIFARKLDYYHQTIVKFSTLSQEN